MKQPEKKNFHIHLLVIILLSVLLLLSLLRTPKKELRKMEDVINRLETTYDERTLYKSEKQLASFLSKEKKLVFRDRATFLQGRLEFIKAYNTPGNLHDLYMNNALKQFRMNISASSNYLAENLFWLGVSYYNMGENNFRDAQQTLIDSLRRGYTDRIKIIKILNNIYLKNNDFQTIIDLNQEFLKKRFYDAELLLSLASAYKGSGNPDKAKEVLSFIKSLKEKPQEKIQREVYGLLADLQYEGSQWKEAAENYDLCFRIGGSELLRYPDMRFRYAECLVAIGEQDVALSILEEMLKPGSGNRAVSTLYNKLKESKANDF